MRQARARSPTAAHGLRAHRSKKARARFAKLQHSQLTTLQKQLGRCE